MKCKLKNIIGYIEKSHERLHYNNEEKRFWDESSSKGTRCLLGLSCSFSTRLRLSDLGFWQNPTMGGKLVHTNHPPGLILGSHPALPREYPVPGGSLRMWEMCYGYGGCSVYGVRGMIIYWVSPNLRTCLISEGVYGVMATSQVLQMLPWCFKEGKSNPPLSETILGKGEEEINRK